MFKRPIIFTNIDDENQINVIIGDIDETNQCNSSSCYNSALPGLINPTKNNSDGSDSSVISDMNQNWSGNSASSMAYADPNGDVNVKISGPYDANLNNIEETNFQVFISKENAREKLAIFKHFGFGKKLDNSVSITPSVAVIYSELDEDNPDLAYYYLKLRYQDIVFARGTYVVRIYVETEPNSGKYDALKTFTLTVKSDPIQGPYINKKYIDTNNRLVNFDQQGKSYF